MRSKKELEVVGIDVDGRSMSMSTLPLMVVVRLIRRLARFESAGPGQTRLDCLSYGHGEGFFKQRRRE